MGIYSIPGHFLISWQAQAPTIRLQVALENRGDFNLTVKTHLITESESSPWCRYTI